MSFFTVALVLSLFLGTFTTNDLSHSFLFGGPTNLYFDFYSFIMENWISLTSAIILMFGISATIVASTGGKWKMYGEHLLWIVAIALGLFSYVVPGIIIWAVMAYYKGLPSALLVLLGPIGSGIVASSDTLQTQFSAQVPVIETSGFGAGQGIFSTIVGFLHSRVAGRTIGLTFLILFTILGALGVVSVILWHFSPFLHLIVYLALGVALAYSVVKTIKNMGIGEPSLPWIVASVALFVLMVSIADILVSGLSWVGAMAPRAVPGGLIGNLDAGQVMVLLSVFSGPIFGALFGQFLSERGWSMKRVAVAIGLILVGFIMVMAVMS